MFKKMCINNMKLIEITISIYRSFASFLSTYKVPHIYFIFIVFDKFLALTSKQELYAFFIVINENLSTHNHFKLNLT